MRFIPAHRLGHRVQQRGWRAYNRFLQPPEAESRIHPGLAVSIHRRDHCTEPSEHVPGFWFAARWCSPDDGMAKICQRCAGAAPGLTRPGCAPLPNPAGPTHGSFGSADGGARELPGLIWPSGDCVLGQRVSSIETNVEVATMVNRTGPGPWKPCETGGFRGVIVGSAIDAAVDSTTSRPPRSV